MSSRSTNEAVEACKNHAVTKGLLSSCTDLLLLFTPVYTLASCHLYHHRQTYFWIFIFLLLHSVTAEVSFLFKTWFHTSSFLPWFLSFFHIPTSNQTRILTPLRATSEANSANVEITVIFILQNCQDFYLTRHILHALQENIYIFHLSAIYCTDTIFFPTHLPPPFDIHDIYLLWNDRRLYGNGLSSRHVR